MKLRPLTATVMLGTLACAGLGVPASTAVSAPAPAQQALVIGKERWTVLGGNTGAGAKAFGDEMVAAGYGTTIDTDGRSVEQVYKEVPAQEVLFIHGHGSAGTITTEDTSPTGKNQYFFAQIPLGLDLWDVQPPAGVVEWDDYLPAAEVDDLLLAILSGCKTAEKDDYWGSLPEMLPSKGVDAVVTIFGNPAIPIHDHPSSMTYGNYYWARVGYYLRVGDNVRNATSKAVQDLIAAEGSASGWDRHHISGAAPSPGSTTVVPPRPGTTILPPVGLLPGTASSLRASASTPETLPTGDVIDADTVEGIALRRDADNGVLLGAWGNPAVTGSEIVTREQARDLAGEFLNAETPNGISITQSSSTEGEPVAGARVLSTHLRYLDDSGREGFAIIEVDLRTGRVVTFNRAQAPTVPDVQPALGRSDAAAIALELVGEGAVVDVERRAWTDLRWVVTINKEARDGHRQLEEISVDANDGRIVGHATS